MVQDWNRKQSFLSIARRWNFSPILTAYFIMTEKGITRKRFWEYVRDPESVHDKRLQKEFREIAEQDMVYSPKGMEIQYARGRWGELKLADWLKWKGVCFKTEKDLRGKSAKTPDCLLDKPYIWNNTKISWIESKAIFGDEVEFRKHIRKQLKPYTEMFGNGIVVYWFGFTDNLVPPEGIFIVDAKFFEIPKESNAPSARTGEGLVIGPKSLVDKTRFTEVPPMQAIHGPSFSQPQFKQIRFQAQAPQQSQQPNQHLSQQNERRNKKRRKRYPRYRQNFNRSEHQRRVDDEQKTTLRFRTE
jgi:hypothetical protein